jgi:beta-N-acetylhexosaminidase
MNLKAKPFYLNDEQIMWVDETLRGMSIEDKLGQLFCFMCTIDPAKFVGELDRIGIRPAGILLRGAPAAQVREKITYFQNYYKVPLLIAGDLDRGASNMITDGTACGHQMEIGATGDPGLAYKTGLLCAQECAAVGANWNFGPVVDIDMNPYSPITNVRTFGSDPDRVLEFASAIARGMRDGGLIPCVKHWPGDGVDFRDQHFLASVNSLSVEDWDATYGKVYQGMIDDGVETLMTAHIMLPAYSRYFNPELKDEELLPGSLNYDLHNRLLREKLGFNGLIITDATTMAGFTECMPRSQAVPACIASGADMFLFSRDMEEDFYYMRKGLEDGILTVERIDEAVTRTLALKAKINLHARKAEGTLIPSVEALDIFKKPDGEQLAKEIADKGITLVKDTQKLLPFTSAEKKNVYLIALGDEGGYHNPRGGYVNRFKSKLEEKGFNVTLFNRETPNEPINFAKEKIEELKKKIDVIIYFGNVQTNGSDSAARISWPGLRITLPLLNKDIPTMLVSIDNPYLLIDAPRMATYINAYTSEDIVVDAVVEKIVGESPFKGVSPIDPFAGIFGATL